MFKSMFKRSWLSITRKTSRTIILIIILFVMANLMLATIAIQRAVVESTDRAKASLGGIVYLQPDMEKVRQEAMKDAQSLGGGNFRAQIKRPNIPIAIVMDIANSEYVKDLTYQLNASANANSFEAIDLNADLPAGAGFRIGGPMGRGDISITGINAYDFIAGVENGSMSLSSGHPFDESTENGTIISYDLADKNNLKIGDQITLTTTDETSPKSITLDIVGIYDSTTEAPNQQNMLYMNVQTATQFLLEEDYIDDSYSVGDVKFFLTSAEHKDAFIEQANAKYPNLADDKLTLNIDIAAYEQMAGPIESVGNFAAVMLLIVIVASVLIITLIITINVKDRRYEMGVLMSLGATKKNILGQNLAELLIIGTTAFVLSILPSAFVAHAMGNGLLEQQVATSQQNQQTGMPMRGMMGSGGMTTQGAGPGGGPVSFMGGNPFRSDVETIDEINVTPSVQDYLILFLAGYSIIILALVIPTANILRFQPKIILTGKE
ncbi:FtsX-like permease family protein [Candidatus Saccharibacteria bacterium]|nr:FtsX-like permease family protein [Candidatus Saccharibacteria bacterium]